METASRYKLVTKAFASVLRDYSRTLWTKVCRAALETLSIIAYKPITRVEVDDIRGVNSSGAVPNYCHLIWSVRRWKKRSLGRLIYVTTEYFFGLYGIIIWRGTKKVEEVDIDQREGQLFSENKRDIRWELTNILPMQVWLVSQGERTDQAKAWWRSIARVDAWIGNHH